MQFRGKPIGKVKRVRDPIYGFIEIPEPLLAIVDNRLVQRLRWVGQLPLEQLVYPSAQHSRFEHSLGTMWLSLCAAWHLLHNSRNEMEQLLEAQAELKSLSPAEREEQYYLAAATTGLLHDAGHAPFSHTLEEAFGYVEKIDAYDHEKIGFDVACNIFQEQTLEGRPFIQIVRQVLNKRNQFDEKSLSLLEYVLRQLVDGPFDVDKGD